MEEKWIDIYEFPRYAVSSLGRFRNNKTGRILSISSNGKGVPKVVLSDGTGQHFTRAVAPLVALQFHGEPPPGNVVIHKDFDQNNCAQDNLEWKPRWFAYERAAQHKRIEPMRNRRILVDRTGEIFDNSLDCANYLDIIEKYVVLAAGSGNRYMGSTYQWVD